MEQSLLSEGLLSTIALTPLPNKPYFVCVLVHQREPTGTEIKFNKKDNPLLQTVFRKATDADTTKITENVFNVKYLL